MVQVYELLFVVHQFLFLRPICLIVKSYCRKLLPLVNRQLKQQRQQRQQKHHLKIYLCFICATSRLFQLAQLLQNWQAIQELNGLEWHTSEERKMKNSPSCVHVLHKTVNVVISRCCFAEDRKEMYQNVKRTCRAIVFPIVLRRCHCRCLCLKGHSHLVHMRIRYHFLADLHITLQQVSR